MYLNSNSLMRSNHIRISAWLEHAPFVFWLMDILRPRNVVELGTHNGFSFLSMCQAAKSLRIDATIYAVDSWQGDEHAGFYSSEIYDALEAELRAQYPGIGVLVRSTFDEARPQFFDGSVDLLHIDGRHRYDDVLEDFENWKSSLSDRGVILFHDTRVQTGDFGVWKFWKELEQAYPTFEFFHGNGLGILMCGKNIPQPLVELCKSNIEEKQFTRDIYARLGSVNSILHQLEQVNFHAQSVLKECELNRSEIDFYNSNSSSLGSIVRSKWEREKEVAIATFDKSIKEYKQTYDSKISALQNDVHSQSITTVKALKDLEIEKEKNRSLLASRSWKLAAPYRYLGHQGRRVARSIRALWSKGKFRS